MASEQASNKRPAGEEAEANGHDSKKQKQVGGVLIFSGLTDYDSRNEQPNKCPDIKWLPHKFEALEGISIVQVSSSPQCMHFFALSDEGDVYAWGYNATGELGLGDMKNRQTPTLVKALSGHNIKQMVTGRHHSMFLSEEGVLLACGDNKVGQCGVGKKAGDQVTTPTVVPVPNGAEIAEVACGSEFSVILDTNGIMYSFGHPENGQLGHGSENKFLEKANKVEYRYEHTPREITSFVLKESDAKNPKEEVTHLEQPRIKQISCGAAHTAAVDEDGRVFTWGFGGYGRLGHNSPNNELLPRLMKCWYRITGKADSGVTRVTCGGQFTIADTIVKNMKYMWGIQVTSTEANMYPKSLDDLMGWNVRSTCCSSSGWMVAADDKVIASFPSPCFGQLAMGEKKKSSKPPTLVDTLKNLYIKEVGVGFMHSLFIARNETFKDKDHLGKVPTLSFS